MKKQETKNKQVGKIRAYFNGVNEERKKIIWPSAKKTARYTLITLAFVIFMSLFFYGIILLIGVLKGI